MRLMDGDVRSEPQPRTGSHTALSGWVQDSRYWSAWKYRQVTQAQLSLLIVLIVGELPVG